MKRQLLLICAAMMILGSFAQVFKKNPSYTPKTDIGVTHRATITPTDDQIWWGYFYESDFDIYDEAIGVGSKNPFLAAIAIPANHDLLGSATIKAVRIYLADGIPSTISDLRVWVSKTLPSSIDAADYVQTVSDSYTVGANDIELTTPYVVNNESFYIGYYINCSASYPIRCGGNDQKDAFWLYAPGRVNWTDLAGQGFGKLAFQIMAEGATIPENSAMVANDNIGNVYGPINNKANAKISITNNGRNALSSIDYTITTDDQITDEYHADLTSPITFGESATITVSIPTEEAQSIKAKTFTVTKTNGETNESSNNKAQFTLYSLSEIIDRNVVVEEYTGTGCGWCPRGLIGMEKLRNTFGDRFVGIGIHRYNSNDPMYISSYAPVSFSGAPSCRIDRGEETDPYYGSDDDICNDFRVEMAVPGLGSVEVNGMFDEEFKKVNATANAKTLFDGTYSLEFALVADGLKGTGTAWNQSNYYYQYSASQLPEDLRDFASGGKYGKASITGWTFNDVAIASSYVGGSNKVEKQTLTAGESADFSYTLTLPTKTTLKNALQNDQIYVIAILVDSNGNIVNAAKKKVEEYTPSAIQTINKDTNATEKARYTLDGHEISAPQHGINIVKMSDGTVRKVTVK